MALFIEKGSYNFNVSFCKPCFVCNNPTRITFKVENPIYTYMCLHHGMYPPTPFLEAFMTWEAFYDMKFIYNLPVYRCFDGKARLVCIGCYLHRYRHNDIRKMETHGSSKFKFKSKTRDEILEWFQRLDTFRKRKDCDQFFIDFSDRWQLET